MSWQVPRLDLSTVLPQEHRKMHFKGATQSVRTEDVHPPRKILAVVTVGRYTCAGKRSIRKIMLHD